MPFDRPDIFKLPFPAPDTKMNVELKIINSIMIKYIPKYESTGAAGIDLRACIEESISLKPGESTLVGTGLAINIKRQDYGGFIFPRSGLGHKQGLVLGNLVGVIDSDYQGEIKISLWNRSNEVRVIQPFDRIAQLVFIPIVHAVFDVVDTFEKSERGENGFGSTGNQ